jgi:hypothetical protein
MSRLTKYVPAVVGYRERLATLQGAWDSLALLSHSSDDGTNLSNTREARPVAFGNPGNRRVR